MNNYKDLIDRLIEVDYIDQFNIKQYKPILIGDILHKVDRPFDIIQKLFLLWSPLGFTKSLQEILEENTITKTHNGKTQTKELIDEAKTLFDFLLELN